MRIYLKNLRSRYVFAYPTLLCNTNARFIFRYAGDGERKSSEETTKYVIPTNKKNVIPWTALHKIIPY